MLYQIELDLSDVDYDFPLPSAWQKKLALLDTTTSQTKVRLKIAGITVYPTYFMGIDEGRYFFPNPRPTLDESIYYLEKNSLEFQIGHIISRFSQMHPRINDIYSLCNELGIEIR